MNKLEKIFHHVRDPSDNGKTSLICSNLFVVGLFDFRVFIDVSISTMTSYDPYRNDSLVMTLQVDKDGEVERWIEMKKSSVSDGGFGVFACREFRPGEFVTAYLGKKVNTTYTFKDIVGLPQEARKDGFHEEYWFGHRINHGSGSKKNLEIRGNFILRATKKIKVNQELFWDYNRDCYCENCKKLQHFYTNHKIEKQLCSKCKQQKISDKYCTDCNGSLCIDCYDRFQVTDF